MDGSTITITNMFAVLADQDSDPVEFKTSTPLPRRQPTKTVEGPDGWELVVLRDPPMWDSYVSDYETDQSVLRDPLMWDSYVSDYETDQSVIGLSDYDFRCSCHVCSPHLYPENFEYRAPCPSCKYFKEGQCVVCHPWLEEGEDMVIEDEFDDWEPRKTKGKAGRTRKGAKGQQARLKDINQKVDLTCKIKDNKPITSGKKWVYDPKINRIVRNNVDKFKVDKFKVDKPVKWPFPDDEVVDPE